MCIGMAYTFTVAFGVQCAVCGRQEAYYGVQACLQCVHIKGT